VVPGSLTTIFETGPTQTTTKTITQSRSTVTSTSTLEVSKTYTTTSTAIPSYPHIVTVTATHEVTITSPPPTFEKRTRYKTLDTASSSMNITWDPRPQPLITDGPHMIGDANATAK
jgi:hypothetical protein